MKKKNTEIRDKLTLRLPHKVNMQLKKKADELGISQNEYILLLLNQKLDS